MEGWESAAVTIGGLITALGGAQGIRALLRRRPRPNRADAAVALSAGTIRWAEKLEATADRATKRAESAEQKADDADRRADQAQRHASRIETQLEVVVAYLDSLLTAIYDPDDTVTAAEHLRRIQAVAARRPAQLRKDQP